jgi:hypothetical protein
MSYNILKGRVKETLVKQNCKETPLFSACQMLKLKSKLSHTSARNSDTSVLLVLTINSTNLTAIWFNQNIKAHYKIFLSVKVCITCHRLMICSMTL